MHDPLAGETPEKYPQKRKADTSGRVLKKTLVQLELINRKEPFNVKHT